MNGANHNRAGNGTSGSAVRRVSMPALELPALGGRAALSRASVEAELSAAAAYAAPNDQRMSDSYGPPPGHPVPTRWGPLCNVMLKTMGRDFGLQLLGGGAGVLCMSGVGAAALPYVAVPCTLAACALSAYGCWMSGKGVLGPQPADASWSDALCSRRGALACAIGCTGGAACAGMAAMGFASAFVKSAELAAGTLQLGVRLARTATRDGLTQFTAGCTGTIRAVDPAAIDRGLKDPRMARMEATRLVGSCLCYTGMQLVSIFAAQPALASCMDAKSLSSVIADGGGFDARALAMTPGLLAGAGVEGLDGLFGTLIATLAALESGNKVVAEQGRNPLKVLKENLQSLEKAKERILASIQHGAMRMYVNNLFADLNLLMSMSIDESTAERVLAAATVDKGGVAIGLTEFRGKLVNLYKDYVKETSNGSASGAQAVRYDPAAGGFVAAPGAYAHDDPDGDIEEPDRENKEFAESKEGKTRSSRIDDPLDAFWEKPIDALRLRLRPGVTFEFHGVPCKVLKVNEASNAIEIAAERPLGGEGDDLAERSGFAWIGSDTKKGEGPAWWTPGDYRYKYEGKLSVISKQLFAEHVLPETLKVVTQNMVLAAGLDKAAGLRVTDRDGEEQVVPIRKDGKDGKHWQAGSFSGRSREELASKLIEDGLTLRDLVFEDPKAHFEVARDEVRTASHLESLLERPGTQFALTAPGYGPAEARTVMCIVTPARTLQVLGNLPNFVIGKSGGGRIGYDRAEGVYRANSDVMAHWIASQNFEVREIVTASPESDPSVVDRKSQPLPLAELQSLPVEPFERALSEKDLVIIGGVHCKVEALIPRQHPEIVRLVASGEPLQQLADLDRDGKGSHVRGRGEWRYDVPLDKLPSVHPLLIGSRGVVVDGEHLKVHKGHDGKTILSSTRGEPNAKLIAVFGAEVAESTGEGYLYKIPRDVMASNVEEFRDALRGKTERPAPPSEATALLIETAPKAIRKSLMPVFGVPEHRDSKRQNPATEAVRRDNQDMLSTILRILNGRSFLQGGIQPVGGVRKLLDLDPFPREAEKYKSTLDQIDMALAHGAGSPVAKLPSSAARFERARSQELAAVMGNEAVEKLVGSYLPIPDETIQRMADAAVLIAAGSPADSPARAAAREFKRYAETQGESGGDLRRRLDDLRGNFADPLRQQAWAYLESEFEKLG